MPTTTGPGVRVPPPVPFLAAFLVAWLLERQVVRIAIAQPGPSREAGITAGWLTLALGLALIVWGLVTLFRARTAILPFKEPASRLVVTGPYQLTRNPMYVGFSLVYSGLALLLNWGWPLLLLPFVLVALYRLVIRLEERHLESAFGAEYAVYRRQVRRWM